MTLVQAILAALLALAPPSHQRPLPGWPVESPEAVRARYASIAADIAAVSTSRSDAADLVGAAIHESGLAADVDAGQCYRGPGHEARCDSGAAHTIWQLQLVPEDLTRRQAARVALGRLQASRRRCRHLEPALRLAAFASGSCAHGHKAARALDEAIRRALAAMP